jgi:hypothetical protein
MDSSDHTQPSPKVNEESANEQELAWLSPTDRELMRLADAWDRLYERLGPLPTQPEA